MRRPIGGSTSIYLSSDAEHQMNWDIIAGKWKQMTGEVQQKWGKLTGDDLDLVDGKREALVGRIQERYGLAKDEAEKQVAEFEASIK